jgi:hypothetical protein
MGSMLTSACENLWINHATHTVCSLEWRKFLRETQECETITLPLKKLAGILDVGILK